MAHTEGIGRNKRIEEIVRELCLNHGVGGEHLICRLADVTVGDRQTELQSLRLTSKYRNIENSDIRLQSHTEYRLWMVRLDNLLIF